MASGETIWVDDERMRVAFTSDDKSSRANQPRAVSLTRDGAMQLTGVLHVVQIATDWPG